MPIKSDDNVFPLIEISKDGIGKKMLNVNHIKGIISKINSIDSEKIYCNQVLERIGTASYMARDYRSYIEETEITNKFMLKNFKNLYKILKDELESSLGTKCVYPGFEHSKEIETNYALSGPTRYPNLAMPGFHIFKGGSFLGKGWNVASIHVDLQYKKIDWPEDKIFDLKKTLSFTLAISIPVNSGLFLFDKKYNPIELKENDNFIIPGLHFRNMKKQKINYKVGKLYLHDGHTYHMISSFNSRKDRITLQGHGIYNVTDDEYWLYW